MSPSGDGWFGRPILRPAKEPPLPQIQHPAGHPRRRVPVRFGDFDADDHLRFVEEIVARTGLPEEKVNELRNSINRIKGRCSDTRLNVAVIGEFSCGKSTFVNALLKAPLAPSSILITTATATRFVYGNTQSIAARFTQSHDSNSLDSSGDLRGYWARDTADVARWVARKLTLARPPESVDELLPLLTTEKKLAPFVADVTVHHPAGFLKRDIVIIDTPGLNADSSRHFEVTRKIVREDADALVVLIPSLHLLPTTLRRFLSEETGHLLNRAIFMITMLDLRNREEEEEIIEYVDRVLSRELGISNRFIQGCAALSAENCEPDSYWAVRFRETEAAIRDRLERGREVMILERVLPTR